MKFSDDELDLMDEPLRSRVKDELHPLLSQLEAVLKKHGWLGVLGVQLSVEKATPEEAGGADDMVKILMGRFKFSDDTAQPENKPGPHMLAMWSILSGLVDPRQVAILAERSKRQAQGFVNGIESLLGGLTDEQRKNLEKKMGGSLGGGVLGRRPPREQRKPVEWEPIEDDDGNILGFRDPTGEQPDDMLN